MNVIDQKRLDRYSDMLHERAGHKLEVFSIMSELSESLREVRKSNNLDQWTKFVRHFRTHRLFARLVEDPFTSRAFQKPRGYAGDAVMLDMLYDETPISNVGISTLGQSIFEYGSTTEAPVAVRQRRVTVAQLLYNAKTRPSRVMSVACGHLRELDLIEMSRIPEAIFALDQDSESLAHVLNRYPNYPIKPLPLSIKELVIQKDHQELKHFDLIYSTGLFDYFSQRIAKRITQSLFRMLRPEGRLFIANFSPSIQDVGYMECVMDWWLVYRSQLEMADLVSDIPKERIDHVCTTRDVCGHMNHIEIVKAA